MNVQIIIIWAPTFEKHIHRLRLVFNRIRAAGLKLKPTKFRFLRKEVALLGHVVCSDRRKTDPGKVEAVNTWPVQTNVKEVQSFLGLANYYRNFILGFSVIAEPLYQLCRKILLFNWQQEQQSAFEELKDPPGKRASASVSQFQWWGRVFHTWHWCKRMPGDWRCFVPAAVGWNWEGDCLW